MKNQSILQAAAFAFVIFTGCAKNNTDATSATEDTSTSGAVASAVGGAYNSDASGTYASVGSAKPGFDPNEWLAKMNPISNACAATACPTFTSGSLASCVSGGNASLTYSSCGFGSSTAVWNGGVALTCSGTVANPIITRVVNQGTTRTNVYGSVVTINTTSPLSTYSGSGAGSIGGGTTLNKSANTITINGVQFVGSKSGRTLFSHTINSSVIGKNGDGTYSGSVTVYHNLAHISATSQLTSLGFTSGCCTPTSGTITTTFSSSGSPILAGYSGATESIQFTGCGTGTYTGPAGYSGSIALANCM